MERRAARRSYLPWTWWYPGDQSQSTDFITRWANGHVQLTRIVRAALAVCRGNTPVHVAATPQIVLLYRFVCVLRARQRTQNTHKPVYNLRSPQATHLY